MEDEHRRALDAAVLRVVHRGRYVLGPEVESFERELAKAIGTSHAIGVANGTDALQIALMSVGVEEGAEVVTVANAGGYASAAIRAAGASPVYVDVDDSDLLLDAAALLPAITPRTRAVVVTHLYGRLAPVEAVMAICRPLGISVVEDCAQAIGASRQGRSAGSIGDVASFSFYPTKNLGALGDGGAVLTSDDQVARRVRQLRQYGWSQKYIVTIAHGRNSRLDEIQAAVLRLRLPRLSEANQRRRTILQAYFEEAAKVGVRTTGDTVDEQTVAHLAVLRCDERDVSRRAAQGLGVATDVHYPVPDHLQLVHAGAMTRLPVTEQASREVLTVPCFPELTDLEVERVCSAIRKVFR
jgi:dTDP-4-amino-4,6-dideoxygalactose transaminase